MQFNLVSEHVHTFSVYISVHRPFFAWCDRMRLGLQGWWSVCLWMALKSGAKVGVMQYL